MSTPGNRHRHFTVAPRHSPSPNLEQKKRLRKTLHCRKKSVRKSLFEKEKHVSHNISSGTPILDKNKVPSNSNSTTSQFSDSNCFWTNPPSPGQAADAGSGVNRRSMRLRTKYQFPFAQISDSQSPKAEVTATTSDIVFRCKTLDTGLSQTSGFSDYGTSSENSLYFHPAHMPLFHPLTNKNVVSDTMSQSRSNQPCISSFIASSGSQSIGYASDLDDCMSNLSMDDVLQKSSQDSKKWDSDDDVRDCKESEWEFVPDTNESHISLKDISSEKVRVFLKTYKGIKVLCPLEGYEILRSCKIQTSRPSGSRSRRYLLRKQPEPRLCLENILSIEVFDDINIGKYFFKEGLRVVQVSPVISVLPHEVKFCSIYPAIVQIPLAVHPATCDEVHILYSRYTAEDNLAEEYTKIPWKSVEAGMKHSIVDGIVSFETYDFGLFVVVIRPKTYCSTKSIRGRVGGILFVPELPGVEVNFPKEVTANKDTLETSARVFFDTEEPVSEVLKRLATKIKTSQSDLDMMDEIPTQTDFLATPIIQLEPHGSHFPDAPVMVTLPIPDYDAINAPGSNLRLSIWQSNTAANETSNWEVLNVQYKITKSKVNGEDVTLVTFPVRHFSFFKGVWDAFSNYLYDSRLGFGMMYYFVSFAMKCQANMEEQEDEKDKNQQLSRFVLGVSVFQADQAWPSLSTYKFKVGQSYPKLVKPGKLYVKLKSKCFIANVDVGEDADMIQEESDFRGRDFEKQFSCKFLPEKKIERGAFGKVLVTRQGTPRQKEQLIFEFNIQKYGNETEVIPSENNEDEWALVALKELAMSLFITDGDNWRIFATEIGMTKQEIKSARLKNDTDVFHKLVGYYKSRGATVQEFVNAMYQCHRKIKISGGCSPQSKLSRSSNGSSGRGSLSSNNVRFDRYGSHDSDTSATGTQTSQDSGMVAPGRKRSHPSVQRSMGSGSIHSTKYSKRRKVVEKPSLKHTSDESDLDADAETSSEPDRVPGFSGAISLRSIDESKIYKDDKTKLKNLFLWEISEHINNVKWRALGRTLGLDEPTLIDVDHAHSKTSFRECAFQTLLCWQQKYPSKCTYGTLYSALIKEDMNIAAKEMANIDRNGDD